MMELTWKVTDATGESEFGTVEVSKPVAVLRSAIVADWCERGQHHEDYAALAPYQVFIELPSLAVRIGSRWLSLDAAP